MGRKESRLSVAMSGKLSRAPMDDYFSKGKAEQGDLVSRAIVYDQHHHHYYNYSSPRRYSGVF